MKCEIFLTVFMLLLPLISAGKKEGQLKTANASVEITEGQNKVSTCGGYVTNNTIIKYPAYGNYRNYEDCTWVIDLQENYTLRFTKMDLEGSDWVSVDVTTVNGTNTAAKYCGHSLPLASDIHLYGRHELKFHSDYSNTYTGFEVSIESDSNPYIAENRRLTWGDAEHQCQEYRAHLVTITSDEKQSAVSNAAKNLSAYPWIGLTDIRREGHWEGVDPRYRWTSYRNWYRGEPNGLTSENCVETYGIGWNGGWNDLNCEHRLPFICERGGLRCNGKDNGCCTREHPCGVGDGDCDHSYECAGSLVCGTDNCPWGDGDDCCMETEVPTTEPITSPSPTQSACGGHVTNYRNIEYPAHGYYHNYEDCTWYIDLAGFYKLRFHMMDVEDCGGNCYCDSVHVNGSFTRTPANTTFCGSRLPEDIHLQRSAWVRFHSDYSNVGRGFRLSVESDSPPPTDRPTDRPSPVTGTQPPAPIGSDNVRRLHGMDFRIENLSSNVAKILRILKNIPSTSGVGEVLKDVRQITSIKKILSGAVIRFPHAAYGDINAVDYYVQGHVEILHANQWGTLCDDSFDDGFGERNANVLCRMGGYKNGTYDGGRFKQQYVKKAPRIWLDDVYCDTGKEESIGKCRMGRPWGSNNCGHGEDVGIRCYI